MESFPEVVIFLNDWLMVLHTDLLLKEWVILCLAVSPAPLLGPEGAEEGSLFLLPGESLSCASPATPSLMERLLLPHLLNGSRAGSRPPAEISSFQKSPSPGGCQEALFTPAN